MEFDMSQKWPKDAYILVGLMPRDTKARFRGGKAANDCQKSNLLTDYFALFSSSFFKFHEATPNL